MNEPLRLFLAECGDLLGCHPQLAHEDGHHLRLVLDDSGFQLGRTIDGTLRADGRPELLAGDLELVAEHAAEPAGADRLLARVRDVRLQVSRL